MIVPIETMTVDLFTPLVGQTFAVDVGEAEPFPVILAEASALPVRGPAPLRPDPFHLLFVSQGPQCLNQMIHRLDHPDLGRIEIFMTPIGREGDGFRYQSIFN